MGTDPNNSSDVPLFNIRPASDAYGRPSVYLKFRINQQAYGRVIVQQATTLTGAWSNTVPEIVSSLSTNNAGQSVQELTVQLPTESLHSFYRLILEYP